MRRALNAGLWGLLGLVGSALLTFFGGVLIGDIAGISQAEGAYAMSLAFFWAPVGAVLGAGLGAWYGARR